MAEIPCHVVKSLSKQLIACRPSAEPVPRASASTTSRNPSSRQAGGQAGRQAERELAGGAAKKKGLQRERITFSTGRLLKDREKRPATRTRLTPGLPTGHLPPQHKLGSQSHRHYRKKAARFLKESTLARLVGTVSRASVYHRHLQSGSHKPAGLPSGSDPQFPQWKLSSSFLNSIPSPDG